MSQSQSSQFFYTPRQSQSPEVYTTSATQSPDITQTPKRPIMTKDGLAIPPTPFLSCLGMGTGVNVWELKNPGVMSSPWAVKNVRKAMEASQQQRFQKLINREAEVLADIQHANIIGYRGLLKAVDGRHCLAMESCGTSLGDLIEQRDDNSEAKFTPVQITKVALSIAKALNYLHTEKKLLHGDIKSYNILVKGDFDEVKLCDFGVCVELNEDGVADSYTGTSIYNAPEVVNEEDSLPITAKCEIFSLGLVIWEMLALKPPHVDQFDSVSTCPDSSQWSDSALNISQLTDLSCSVIGDLPDIGTRPALPEGLGPKYNPVVDLFRLCTEENPDSRPSAADIVRMLQP